jgi:hypothetical protein
VDGASKIFFKTCKYPIAKREVGWAAKFVAHAEKLQKRSESKCLEGS